MSAFIKIIINKLIKQLTQEDQIGLNLDIVKNIAASNNKDTLEKLIKELDLLQVNIEDMHRKCITPIGKVDNWENESADFKLIYSIMEANAPWKEMNPKVYNVPGMITWEEVCYYHYIAKSYSGWGEVIELGPWLGHSTIHLAEAFANNPKFNGRKINVFDDFVWRSAWMDPIYTETDRPKNHEDFRHIFEKYVDHWLNKLRIFQGKFANFDGNENLPYVTWENKPIEMIIVDCGRTLEANNGWYNIFSKNFVPNRTIVIMQDWRQHRERPRKHFNQTLEFTKRKPNLELIHEVSEGGVAAFLYR